MEQELENGYNRLEEIARAMTIAELVELWEDSLKLPADQPIPEFIAAVCAELVRREETE